MFKGENGEEDCENEKVVVYGPNIAIVNLWGKNKIKGINKK